MPLRLHQQINYITFSAHIIRHDYTAEKCHMLANKCHLTHTFSSPACTPLWADVKRRALNYFFSMHQCRQQRCLLRYTVFLFHLDLNEQRCTLVARVWMFLIRFLIIVLLLPSVIHPQSLALPQRWLIGEESVGCTLLISQVCTNPMDSPLISTHSLIPEVSMCVCGPPNRGSLILKGWGDFI